MRWDNYYSYPTTSPKPVKNGIKAKSKRGEIGSKWWSKRFLETLNRMGMDSRLKRGRTYARKGQVMDLSVVDGIAKARVQGSGLSPYGVTIRMKQWDDKEWKQVISEIAEQALYSAQMLNGEMPHDIEGVVRAAGVRLFPEDRNDIKTTCTCPDYANPCKHIAAVYYILAEQFDEDPFLIFAMRGKHREELLDAIREERGSGESVNSVYEDAVQLAEPVPELNVAGFYDMRKFVEDFAIHLSKGPDLHEGLLRSLGPSPFFSGKKNLTDLLAIAYETGPLYVQQMIHGETETVERKTKQKEK